MPPPARKPAHAIRVAIVVSRYNASVTDALCAGALRAAALHTDRSRQGVACEVFDAAGAFEVVPIALAAARQARFHAVVALGCIIKGETIHDRVLADAVTQGLVSVALATEKPVGLGVLTVNTPAQARARAGGSARDDYRGNKGAEAMRAVLHTLGTLGRVRSGRAASDEATRAPRPLPDKAASGPRARVAHDRVRRAPAKERA
jgi:6,7-dimethyl-8-ribityllumazine synthase